MADETLYSFNYADSQALLAQIGPSKSGGGSKSDAISDNAIYIGIATSIITARAGTTLGTGTAMLKQTSDANTISDLHSVNVVNAGSQIGSGKFIKVFRIGNKLFAVEIC